MEISDSGCVFKLTREPSLPKYTPNPGGQAVPDPPRGFSRSQTSKRERRSQIDSSLRGYPRPRTRYSANIYTERLKRATCRTGPHSGGEVFITQKVSELLRGGCPPARLFSLFKFIVEFKQLRFSFPIKIKTINILISFIIIHLQSFYRATYN